MKALYQLLESLGFGQWALIVLFLSIFVDVVPVIKFNPLRWLFKTLGKAFNSSVESEIADLKVELNNKMDKLGKEQELQRKTIDRLILENIETEINNYRWNIINFKYNMDNGDKFSRDQYRHILNSFDKYINIMNDKDAPNDEHYLEVKEDGDSIREHYEIHKNDNELLI